MEHPSAAAACNAFWHAYLEPLPLDHPHRAAKPDCFGFGDTPELIDELLALVLAGTKRATTSLAIEFTSLSEPLPRAGDLSIILRGNGMPAAIIERSEVTTVPFEDVTEEYAAIEGEGDASLQQWRDGHRNYFARVCARLGGSFDERTPVICQVFRVVWR